MQLSYSGQKVRQHQQAKVKMELQFTIVKHSRGFACQGWSKSTDKLLRLVCPTSVGLLFSAAAKSSIRLLWSMNRALHVLAGDWLLVIIVLQGRH